LTKREPPVDDPEDIRMSIELLNGITDAVLGYRPKPKTKAAKRRKRKKKKRTQESK